MHTHTSYQLVEHATDDIDTVLWLWLVAKRIGLCSSEM